MESTPLMKDEQPPPSSYPEAPPGYQQSEYPPPQQPGYPPPQQAAYPPPQQAAYPPPQQAAYPPPQQAAYPPQQQQPPPMGYQVQQTQNNTTVITQPVVAMRPVKFSESPVQMKCNTCQQDVVTRTVYTPGLMTWIIVGVLFILGIWPCCLIPLCVDGLKDVDHVCPNCGTTQGSYKRLS